MMASDAADGTPTSPEHDIHSAQFMEDFTTCPLCDREFEDPRMLACLHTYCMSCIQKQQKLNGGTFKCDLCRDGTAIRTKAVELPVNAMVAEDESVVAWGSGGVEYRVGVGYELDDGEDVYFMRAKVQRGERTDVRTVGNSCARRAPGRTTASKSCAITSS